MSFVRQVARSRGIRSLILWEQTVSLRYQKAKVLFIGICAGEGLDTESIVTTANGVEQEESVEMMEHGLGRGREIDGEMFSKMSYEMEFRDEKVWNQKVWN